MNCFKTSYKNVETANGVIKKSAASHIKHRRKTNMFRKVYICPTCRFYHILKYKV